MPPNVIEKLLSHYSDKEAVIETIDDAKKEIRDRDRTFCTKVIEYLNEKAGTAFLTNFPSSSTTLIIARRDETKSTMEDFYRIIDNKVIQWKDKEQEVFLRPKTLFGKTNFSNYLGEKHGKQQQQSNAKSFDKLTNAASEAKRNIAGRS